MFTIALIGLVVKLHNHDEKK
ncbi:MAG: hypothetical protein L0I20_06935 [Lactococcus raffinolactis]|nr:hypothetical protein [Lactococcus raffinolactis]